MTNKQNNEPSVREAEELLKQMANIEPLTRQEVCDWYGIDLKGFPRPACANLEREIEMNRHAPSWVEHLTQQGLQAPCGRPKPLNYPRPQLL